MRFSKQALTVPTLWCGAFRSLLTLPAITGCCGDIDTSIFTDVEPNICPGMTDRIPDKN